MVLYITLKKRVMETAFLAKAEKVIDTPINLLEKHMTGDNRTLVVSINSSEDDTISKIQQACGDRVTKISNTLQIYCSSDTSYKDKNYLDKLSALNNVITKYTYNYRILPHGKDDGSTHIINITHTATYFDNLIKDLNKLDFVKEAKYM